MTITTVQETINKETRTLYLNKDSWVVGIDWNDGSVTRYRLLKYSDWYSDGSTNEHFVCDEIWGNTSWDGYVKLHSVFRRLVDDTSYIEYISNDYSIEVHRVSGRPSIAWRYTSN